jgi:phospholipase C
MPVENTRPSSGLSRREFLAAAGVVGVGVGGWRRSRAASRPERTLPKPGEAPFDTVVVLMMENRSFDHMLGWLPGANGRQAGLSYRDVDDDREDDLPMSSVLARSYPTFDHVPFTPDSPSRARVRELGASPTSRRR